jgi:transcriptional regulator with XRE-family HTH domain
MTKDVFALELLALRRDLGLTQAEFAQMTGFSLRAISAWETGERIPKKRNIQEIHRLCAKYAQEAQHTQNKKLSDYTEPTFTDKSRLPHNVVVKLKDGESINKTKVAEEEQMLQKELLIAQRKIISLMEENAALKDQLIKKEISATTKLS